MIITQTPFRMSFFGGGTDMPDFFLEHGGAVLSTTFDKYCYVTVRHLPRFFDYRTEVVYSKTERVTDVDEIEHPAVRNAMKMLDMHELRISYEGDLPARTGLGTSSSFAVGLLLAFHAMKGKYVSKRQLAEEAIHLERGLCAESGGWQDQIAASFGGLNRIDFDVSGFRVSPIVISPRRKRALESRLMLFFTGFTRMSSDIQKKTNYRERISELKSMLELVDEAQEILTDESAPLSRFGDLLDHTWRLKRGLGKSISTGDIDVLYDRALAAGALGGKLLGSGGGGFLLFYVEPEKQDAVRRAMADLLEIPFEFENEGTRIIHYEPEEWSSVGEKSDGPDGDGKGRL